MIDSYLDLRPSILAGGDRIHHEISVVEILGSSTVAAEEQLGGGWFERDGAYTDELPPDPLDVLRDDIDQDLAQKLATHSTRPNKSGPTLPEPRPRFGLSAADRMRENPYPPC